MFIIDPPKLVLFGDSIIRRASNQIDGFGLAPALQDDYAMKLDVVSRGFSGYHSGHAKALLGPVFAALSNVQLVVLEFGTNDMSIKYPEITLDVYRHNMEELIHTFLARKFRVVVLTPAAIAERKNPDLIEKELTCTRIGEFAAVAKAVALDIGVPFVDQWHGFLESVGWEEGEDLPSANGSKSKLSIDHLFVDDGLHFSGEGYRLAHKLLREVIDNQIPEMSPDNVHTWFANGIDVDDLEGSY